MMKAAVFHGPGELEVTEVDVPKIGRGELLVEVGANTLCGTDGRIFRGEKTKGVRKPSILGHEFAGRVAEVGKSLQNFKVGDTVAMAPVIPCRRCFYCRNGLENACQNRQALGYEFDGGMSEFVRIPAMALESGNLFHTESEIEFEYLALAEPLSCCVNGHKNSEIPLDGTVLIMGAGPIGLFHLQLALLAGARHVTVSEPSPFRREVAGQLGAQVTLDPNTQDLPEAISEATKGLGVDSTIICIGIPRLVNDALHLTRKGGCVNIFAGLPDKGWSHIEANLIHYNELKVTGATAARRSDFETALRLIESRRVDVSPFVTDRFPLSETRAAIDKATSNSEGLKIALIP